MNTTMKVEGLRELGAQFRQHKKDMQLRIAARAVSAGARVIKAAAKANLRANDTVDTSLLAGAVIIKRLPQRESLGTVDYIVTIKKKVYEQDNPKGDRHTRRTGVFVEYGTVKMSAVPYLRIAFESKKGQAKDAIVARLRQELDKGKAT